MKELSEKPKMGRPKAEHPRDVIWPVRLSKQELEIITAKAKQSGKTGGRWIRETLLSA